MDIHPGIVFVILVTVVPLQYYMSPSSSSDMKYYVQRWVRLMRLTSVCNFVHIRKCHKLCYCDDVYEVKKLSSLIVRQFAVE